MDKELIKNLLIAASFVLAFWVASFAWIYLCVGNWEIRGQLGDMFGAVNSLFSGLAFAGLIVTLIIVELLKLNVKEIKFKMNKQN